MDAIMFKETLRFEIKSSFLFSHKQMFLKLPSVLISVIFFFIDLICRIFKCT